MCLPQQARITITNPDRRDNTRLSCGELKPQTQTGSRAGLRNSRNAGEDRSDICTISKGVTRTRILRHATNNPIASVPKNRRPATISIGEMSSSRTFMNRNDEPQMLPISSNTAKARGSFACLFKMGMLGPRGSGEWPQRI